MLPRANAVLRNVVTMDEVLASPMISDPLHRLDCCIVSDGGGALIIAHPDIARELKRPLITPRGAGYHVRHLNGGYFDILKSGGVQSGQAAFEQAGATPQDIDYASLYDSFTITALLHLEDLGFCAKGEGGPFVEDGKLGPGGSLPMNTNGGGLSYTHPGMYGMFLIVEAVRQLRGECDTRQVDGAEVAVAHGSGMVLSCMSTLVLGTAATL